MGIENKIFAPLFSACKLCMCLLLLLLLLQMYPPLLYTTCCCFWCCCWWCLLPWRLLAYEPSIIDYCAHSTMLTLLGHVLSLSLSLYLAHLLLLNLSVWLPACFILQTVRESGTIIMYFKTGQQQQSCIMLNCLKIPSSIFFSSLASLRSSWTWLTQLTLPFSVPNDYNTTTTTTTSQSKSINSKQQAAPKCRRVSLIIIIFVGSSSSSLCWKCACTSCVICLNNNNLNSLRQKAFIAIGEIWMLVLVVALAMHERCIVQTIEIRSFDGGDGFNGGNCFSSLEASIVSPHWALLFTANFSITTWTPEHKTNIQQQIICMCGQPPSFGT